MKSKDNTSFIFNLLQKSVSFSHPALFKIVWEKDRSYTRAAPASNNVLTNFGAGNVPEPTEELFPAPRINYDGCLTEQPYED
jgi:hypothetical protein